MPHHRNNVSTRVGLVASEPIRLAGLFSAFEDCKSIAVAISDLDLLVVDYSLHFLILDLSSSSTWIETQALVRRMRPDMRLIILGPMTDEESILRSIAAGARAYLDPNAGPRAVRQAAEAVIDGSIWAPRQVLSKLIDRLLNQAAPKIQLAPPVFSPRERQVLDLIMAACSNREIAEELGIEERTVKAYVASLLRKTGVDNRVSLSVRATQESMREQRSVAS